MGFPWSTSHKAYTPHGFGSHGFLGAEKYSVLEEEPQVGHGNFREILYSTKIETKDKKKILLRE